ncbi:MAG: hypothetical protein QW212_01060 [Nitrososphaerales archaeon]
MYNQLGGFRGGGTDTLNLLQGRIGGGLTPSAGACGVNAAFSFLYGISNSLGSLDQFINNWQSAATVVALYALATYLPVVKEALLGANTLSNFLAQLRGFSCTQAIEGIKELNYQDSFLIKKCISKKLGISEDDVDVKKNTSPDEWYSAYKSCLNSASFLDFFGGDQNSALKFLKFISPKSLVKCYLGVRQAPTAQELANADLNTRAKYFLYMILPDITLDANGLLKIQTVQIKDQKTGQERPATFVDVMNFHVENFEQDYEDLLKNLKGAIRYDMSYEEAVNAAKSYFDEFERKYGLSAEDIAPTLILLLKMRDYFDRGVKGEITLEPQMDYFSDRDKVDQLLEGEVKRAFLARAIDKLELVLNENFVRLKQAEAFRKSTGSGNLPSTGAGNDCIGSST